MLRYQKNMFDRCYCIKRFLFSLGNFGEIASKMFFTCSYNGAEKHVTCESSENAASRAKTNAIVTVHFTVDDVSFYHGPECLFVKPQSCALIARELTG